MSSKKLNKAQRKAAGHGLIMLFHMSMTLGHGLQQLTRNHPPSGADFSEGLTDKEKEYINMMAERWLKDAERCRRLGWRLLDKERLA